MTEVEFRRARLDAGWTQSRLARRLGVTQAYVSLMESGHRQLPDRVQRSLAALLNLPPTCLPMPAPRSLSLRAGEEQLEKGLAGLGYPPLAFRSRPARRRNPAELLYLGLSLDDLDPRLAEALPWLVVRFEGLDTEELVARAKKLDLQNRLGFTVSLARRVADRNPAYRVRSEDLRRLEQSLEPSRLAREDTYGRSETSERMRVWLRANRTPEAEHWNLLTDLKPEHLPYAGSNPGTVA